MKFSCDNLGFRVNFILLQLQCGYNNMRRVFSIKKKIFTWKRKIKKMFVVYEGGKSNKKDIWTNFFCTILKNRDAILKQFDSSSPSRTQMTGGMGKWPYKNKSKCLIIKKGIHYLIRHTSYTCITGMESVTHRRNNRHKSKMHSKHYWFFIQ